MPPSKSSLARLRKEGKAAVFRGRRRIQENTMRKLEGLPVRQLKNLARAQHISISHYFKGRNRPLSKCALILRLVAKNKRMKRSINFYRQGRKQGLIKSRYKKR